MAHTLFNVHGPFEVPTERLGVGRRIKTNCPEFWKKAGPRALVGQRGCYAFGIRAGRGIRLTYVGKAVRQTFGKECFALHKTGEHYNPALNAVNKGKPVMFLIPAPRTRGKPNQQRISDLESFLTQSAVAKGIALTNLRNRDEKDWGIAGVVRSNRGKPTNPARKLKKALGL